tara:strand:+ start:8041 stop:8574 length:534 start_codon:yes stop_codon:yes gene_type:complete
MKKYSISIPLNHDAHIFSKKCQRLMYNTLSTRISYNEGVDPHINLISGTTDQIDIIVRNIEKFDYKNKKNCKILGFGILITPKPLIFMRFSNSIFLKEIRNFLLRETFSRWDTLTETVQEEIWFPKSTLAYKNFSFDDLPRMLGSLKDLDYNITMEVSELSVIDFTEKEHEVKRFSI